MGSETQRPSSKVRGHGRVRGVWVGVLAALLLMLVAAPAALASPSLADDYPGWWMNTDFTVVLTASDHNSGIAAPGIEYMVSPLVAGHPTTWTVGTTVAFDVGLGALTDGIFDLSYRATDKAGNSTLKVTKIKIDTRAPVTDGASGWINGLVPYVLTATDQVPGAGVAATVYRVDQATPWSFNLVNPVAPVVETAITIAGDHASFHTVDFASVDDARPAGWVPADTVHFGNWEITPPTFWAVDGNFMNLGNWTAYKSRTVQLDKVAPVVTLASPVNTDWQQGPATINFSGTDVGSGYAYTEWSTDGGVTVNKGETAQIGGNGVITVNYRGVDKVGIRSAWLATTVSVATTGPKNAAKSAVVVKGHKATIKFKVTAVTPKASVNILIRKNGVTKMLKRYSQVTTNAWVTRSFTVNLPKGTYLIRVDSVDLAGNVQTVRGQANLTVK